MAVANAGEHYKCTICGNEVKVTKVGGGTLVCCNQEMLLVGVHDQKPIDDEIPV
jgi:desulfoferrodoxin-like iron-binding protein